MEIGMMVKLKRVELGLSQQDLAAKAGCSQPTLVHLEKNSVGTLKTFVNIVNALGMKISIE